MFLPHTACQRNNSLLSVRSGLMPHQNRNTTRSEEFVFSADKEENFSPVSFSVQSDIWCHISGKLSSWQTDILEQFNTVWFFQIHWDNLSTFFILFAWVFFIFCLLFISCLKKLCLTKLKSRCLEDYFQILRMVKKKSKLVWTRTL